MLNGRRIHVKCNWNLAINAFLEGYHTLYLHGKSVPDYQGGRINPDRAKYDGSYRVTAAFLAFVTEKYDPQVVRKLNAAMRAGKYKPEVWKELTGLTVEELGREWQKSLAK